MPVAYLEVPCGCRLRGLPNRGGGCTAVVVGVEHRRTVVECPFVLATSRWARFMHTWRLHTLDPITNFSIRYDSEIKHQAGQDSAFDRESVTQCNMLNKQTQFAHLINYCFIGWQLQMSSVYHSLQICCLKLICFNIVFTWPKHCSIVQTTILPDFNFHSDGVVDGAANTASKRPELGVAT